jgi:hypothetical protein
MCPIAGCVGGPVEIATSQGTPQMRRLNDKFVYWVNADDYTIHRVAKPKYARTCRGLPWSTVGLKVLEPRDSLPGVSMPC